MEYKDLNQIKNKTLFLVPTLIAVLIVLFVLACRNNYFCDLFLVMIIPILLLVLVYLRYDFLTYQILFFSMGVLYASGPILACNSGLISDVTYSIYNRLVWAVVIGLVGFTLGDKAGVKIELFKPCKEHRINHALVKTILIVVLALLIITKLYVVSQIGFYAYLIQGRGATQKLLAEQFRIFEMFNPLIYLVEILSFEMAVKEKEEGKQNVIYKLICIISICVALLIAIIQIDRSSFLMAVLPLIFMLNYHKYISLNKVLLFGGALLVLFIVWKQVIPQLLLGNNILGENIRIDIPGELYAWFNVGVDIEDGLASGKISYKYGQTYLRAFESIVNPLGQQYEPLSKWYVRTFYFEYYMTGGGRGFSCIVEAILNFGLLGPLIVFFFVGFINAYIEKNIYTSSYWRVFYALSLSFVFKIFRSEIYSIVKQEFWFWGVPLIVIWFFAERMKIRN